MNASIRANAFINYNCNDCNACNACNFLMRTYGFRFNLNVTRVICYSPIVFDLYFRLVTVFILWRVVDISRIAADFRDAFERILTPSTRHFSLLGLLSRGGLVFTSGILDRDEAQKMLSRKKLRESGTSSLCKKLLTTSTTQSYMNAFM